MRHKWIVTLLILYGSAALYAQSSGQSSPTTAPSTAEQMLNQMLQPSNTGSNPATRPQQVPALEPQGVVPHHATNNLLREGSDVISRAGHLQKAADGPYSEFVFDQKPAESKLTPMLALPNLQLMSMEDAASATKQDLTFTVSGMVTEYKGRNYILLEPGPDEVGQQLPASHAIGSAHSGPLSADQMLKDMLTADENKPGGPPKSQPLAPDATSGAGSVSPSTGCDGSSRAVADRRSRLPHDTQQRRPAGRIDA